MDYQTILFEKTGTDGAVGLLTLNRPEKLNAWTYEMPTSSSMPWTRSTTTPIWVPWS